MFVGIYIVTKRGWCLSVKNCWMDRARLEEQASVDYTNLSLFHDSISSNSTSSEENISSSSDSEKELLTDY